jgi:hypothetical protein
MILKVSAENKNPIHVEKIKDLDIIIFLKSNQTPPDNKFDLYEPSIRRVAAICQNSKNPIVLFAENSIFVYEDKPVIEDVKSYIRSILNNLGIVDMGFPDEYDKLLSNNSIMTKRRNINLHFIYVFKDVLFDTFNSSNDFFSLFPDKISFISGIEKSVFGNEFNNIQVNIWSNFTPQEVVVLNKYKSINESNWEYKTY